MVRLNIAAFGEAVYNTGLIEGVGPSHIRVHKDHARIFVMNLMHADEVVEQVADLLATNRAASKSGSLEYNREILQHLHLDKCSIKAKCMNLGEIGDTQ